jgi:hypothetical protein
MFILSKKLHSISLAFIIVCPVCCCYGDWLQQLVLPDTPPPSCCSDSEMDDVPEGSSDDCACKTFNIAGAKYDLSLLPSPQGFPGSSILASILSLEAVFPSLFSVVVPPTGLPLFSIPRRIVFQTFII